MIHPPLTKKLERKITEEETTRLLQGISGLKQRARTLLELADSALFYCETQSLDENAKKVVTEQTKLWVQSVRDTLVLLNDFTETTLEIEVRKIANQLNEKLGNIAQPLRVALTGRMVSPSIFEIMAVLDKEETMRRLTAFISDL